MSTGTPDQGDGEPPPDRKKPVPFRSWTARRASEPLSPASVRLIAVLAGRVSLAATSRDFRHVVNRLSAAWNDRVRFAQTIKDLLLTTRPRRRGFPEQVVRELTALNDFHERLFAPATAAEPAKPSAAPEPGSFESPYSARPARTLPPTMDGPRRSEP